MRKRPAERSSAIESFKVMDVMDAARALEQAGQTVIHMEVGEPDFGTPEPVLAGVEKALRKTSFGYTSALGMEPLREAIAQHYLSRFGVSVDPGRIVVTAGASGAILLALTALMDNGDQVIVPDPGYPCNSNMILALGGEPVWVPVSKMENYSLKPEHLRVRLDKKSCVMLASPANPTGAVMTLGQIRDICVEANKQSMAVIVDEIYQGLVYDQPPQTALSIPEELSKDLIIINSFSKYFGMTGWRLGWMVVPDYLLETIERLAQNLFISPSTIAQHAALAAFAEESIEICEQRREAFKRRRDFLRPAIKDLGFKISAPADGAFYLYADCSDFGLPSDQLCQRILVETGVALTPGNDFAKVDAERYLRFAYTTHMDDLKRGVDRLADYLRSL